MRVVGGKYRGAKLFEFDGLFIRPTSDMTKESLFNILREKTVGAAFLDLFAGTGSIGIEALSRGASEVIFTDSNIKSVEIINKNLNKLKLTAKVLKTDAIDYLSSTDKKFDIIFMDPPYKTDLGFKALEKIAEKNVLKEDGLIIFESEEKKDAVYGCFTKIDERKYGRAVLSFFNKGVV